MVDRWSLFGDSRKLRFDCIILMVKSDQKWSTAHFCGLQEKFQAFMVRDMK